MLTPSCGLARSLLRLNRFNKVEWTNGNPYNLRWQYKWKHAYYTYPKDSHESAKTLKPEDSKIANPPGWSYWQDLMLRTVPAMRNAYTRSWRCMDPFQIVVLPSSFLFFGTFWPLALGYKMMCLFSAGMFYTRLRDKTLDPDIKETHLLDLIYKHPELSKMFKPETTHVMDFELEYDQGYPCEQKFPQFKNKFWRFFNSDTHMTTGHFVYGDLDSGATMTLKFKTMPTHGPFRFQVGEPFHYYDVRAEVNHKGTMHHIVITDENEELKKRRPFLIIF